MHALTVTEQYLWDVCRPLQLSVCCIAACAAICLLLLSRQMMRNVVLLLLIAAAAPAFAGRLLLADTDTKGETLTCMTSVIKVGQKLPGAACTSSCTASVLNHPLNRAPVAFIAALYSGCGR